MEVERNQRMLHYFYLLNRPWFLNDMRPALSESWRRRSFAPCIDLCRRLSDADDVSDDALARHVSAGLPFDRSHWHALVSECLLLGADVMPHLPGLADALVCLVAPERLGIEPTERAAFSPIEQVYYGALDFRLGGGWHRPEHVGWNDAPDVERLLAYLGGVDPQTWTVAPLARLPEWKDDAERAEELAYLRDWWPALVQMVAQARVNDQVIVCERP